jgi:hypothetical protein
MYLRKRKCDEAKQTNPTNTILWSYEVYKMQGVCIENDRTDLEKEERFI